jgi:hypothetical protein
MDPFATPTIPGLIAWARSGWGMGITTEVMADDDLGWTYGFYNAKRWVNKDLAITCSRYGSPDYTLAVYNWAGSVILQFQQDYPNQVFFTQARIAFKLDNLCAGTIESASDNSTSGSYAIGAGLKNLDLICLQRIKDPYGRTALAYMQSEGSMWGIS